MSPSATRASLLFWLTASVLCGLGLVRHDFVVALGWERWLVVVQAAAHALLALAWWWICRLASSRRGPRLALAQPILPAVLALGIWGPGLSGRAPVRGDEVRTRAEGPDVVLVTLDTFREDHVGPDTPTLLELAARGERWTQVVTTTPLTGPAHASMLTGQSTRDHGLLSNGRRLQGETLVEDVRRAGYHTGAFLSARVLDRQTGLQPGFEHYDDAWGLWQRLEWVPAVGWAGVRGRPPVRQGDETVLRALQWLGQQDGPSLLWVHLYDAHAPYRPPDAWLPSRAELDEARALDRAQRRGNQGLFSLLDRNRVHQNKLLYQASVRWVDHLVGLLLAGLDPESIVIVVGDHGESLDEHDYFFNHGGRLWEPSLRVPLIVAWPGRMDSGTTHDELVGITAVAGLLRAATGLDELGQLASEEVESYTPGQQARRRSLGERIQESADDGSDGVKLAERPQARQAASIRLGSAKLLSHHAGEVVYYDLAADPEELDPLPVPAEYSSEADRIRSLVDEAVPELSAEERERLEALGYVE